MFISRAMRHRSPADALGILDADQRPTRIPENSEENSRSGVSAFQERASFHRARYRRHETHRCDIARIRLDEDKPPNHIRVLAVRSSVSGSGFGPERWRTRACRLALIQLFGTSANKSPVECPQQRRRDRRASIRSCLEECAPFEWKNCAKWRFRTVGLPDASHNPRSFFSLFSSFFFKYSII